MRMHSLKTLTSSLCCVNLVCIYAQEVQLKVHDHSRKLNASLRALFICWKFAHSCIIEQTSLNTVTISEMFLNHCLTRINQQKICICSKKKKNLCAHLSYFFGEFDLFSFVTTRNSFITAVCHNQPFLITITFT